MEQNKETVKIKIKLETDAILPTRGKGGDACFDLYVSKDTTIEAKKKGLVPTGVRIQLLPNQEATVRNRSGISLNGCPATIAVSDTLYGEPTYRVEDVLADVDIIWGTIDSNYRGVIGIIVRNHEDQDITIKSGTKLAQLGIHTFFNGDLELVTELDDSERMEQGFGSSGVV